MPDPVFPAGTTATIKDEPSGSPTTLTKLRSIGGNESTIAFGDVTDLSDSTLKKRPSRIDPGSLVLTFVLDDTAAASNQVTTLMAKRDAKQQVTIVVNLPGSWDDATPLITYTGYLSSVGLPEITMGDEPLTYTVGLQKTA